MITILLSILASLVANEMCDVSPWCAKKLVRWSAFQRYADDRDRAEVRAEELAALIKDRPGNLLKLGTGACFLAAALLYARRGAHENQSRKRIIHILQSAQSLFWLCAIVGAGFVVLIGPRMIL